MPLDPFSMLGLGARFDVDPAEVERAYLRRASELHPDLVGDSEESNVRLSQLNRAKGVLLRDEARANALLALLGGPGKEEDRSLPEGFLVEIMETREAVEAALASGDPGERARWQAWAAGQVREYRARVAELFRQGVTPGVLRQVRVQLNAWRYIERLIEQLDPRYDPARQNFAE